MKKLLLIALLGAVIPAALQAEPADRPSRADIEREVFGPSTPRAEGIGERNMREAREIADRIERERVREEMRDKSHDHRLPLGKDTSLGASQNGVDILISY